MVRVDILSQQRHFLVSFLFEVFYFLQDTFYVAASLTSPGIRNDAVMAEVVASAHDGDKARDVVAADT